MTTKMETIEILKQAARIKAIRQEMLEELAAIDAAESSAPASRPRVGSVTTVDRWNGSRWVEVELVWNGSRFAEVA